MDDLVSMLVNYGIIGIMTAAFSEAIFLPVPMELISIPVYLVNPARAVYYALILIAFSVAGSVTGYQLSRFLGKPLLHKLVPEKHMKRLALLYEKNALLTLMTAAFTPIPYEAYVLSAGAFGIGCRKFLFATVVSRVIRHLPQAILIRLYGDALLMHLKTYTLVFCVLVFVMVLLFKYAHQRVFTS
ncbi:MAG: VTT domain-containing protein [Bacillota bacterium]|nr:VTT domain-containing protein [Bacillota bacterium]MDW7678546.1 VTT domain-containing protein [Bacillota bacterium]